MVTTTTLLQAGDVVAGKYRVERIVGEGGMGVVIAAWHTELEQHVAIKLLTDEALKNRVVVERFEREARAAVKIKSRHVARVSDVGKLDGGSPYMVMEYLEGQDLEALMEKEGPMPIVRAVDYVLQACDAIAEAHAYGIVHRDLKPANLFLADSGAGSNEIKVLDFGISKSMKNDAESAPKGLTQAHEVFGSPMYMSPEQLTSTTRVDARADIWSLGIILYELVTGDPPFYEGTIAEIWSRILDKPIPLPSTRRASLPTDLEKAIMKALTRDVEKRFQTVAEFAEAIAPFGTGDSQGCVDRAKRFRARMAGVTTQPDAPHSDPRAVEKAKEDAAAARGSMSAIDVLWDDIPVDEAPPEPQPQHLERAAAAPVARTPEPARAAPAPAALRTPLPATGTARKPGARTTTDWQSIPPPRRSKTPTVLIALGVLGAIGASVYFIRARVGEPATPAPTSTAKTDATPRPSEVASVVPDAPSAAPSTTASTARPYLMGRLPLASASAKASASAAPSASAAASAPPDETEEPPPPPPPLPPVTGPLPKPGGD